MGRDMIKPVAIKATKNRAIAVLNLGTYFSK
jgi:hypothetical protein